jgi:hypothetical protein
VLKHAHCTEPPPLTPSHPFKVELSIVTLSGCPTERRYPSLTRITEIDPCCYIRRSRKRPGATFATMNSSNVGLWRSLRGYLRIEHAACADKRCNKLYLSINQWSVGRR